MYFIYIILLAIYKMSDYIETTPPKRPRKTGGSICAMGRVLCNNNSYGTTGNAHS